ncbi:CHAD domain-containing protein [Sinimarinibacterium sp. CAU 1509]|uniref:CHAD domain-containing protein n=1 Tax=Sinimarinibacterium sp. CAU 1509 TaxID=2562283 RepID=UPI0010AD81DD|nr:CHAD domain-containing protein [Sinimarinibacterium sp. CAU 1509]TJY65225.1 CHAD domain-containing protein [Sinimarinibacterium sp. CAU 1509]
MGFSVDPRLTPGAALHQAARRELDLALAGLREPSAETVHQARKSLKKLRAWLRLLRGELATHYVLLNRLLRDAGRSLSGQRDAVVALQTLRRLRLGRQLTQPQYHALRSLLSRQIEASDLSAAASRSRQLMKAARLYLDDIDLGSLDADSGDLTLRRHLRNQHSRCRRQLQRVGARPQAELLHNWRKQVKYLGYQHGLLAPRLREAGADVGALKALGETLGLHHDFHALAQRLERCAQQRDADQLVLLRSRELIQQRLSSLSDTALRQGHALFDTTPKRSSTHTTSAHSNPMHNRT